MQSLRDFIYLEHAYKALISGARTRLCLWPSWAIYRKAPFVPEAVHLQGLPSDCRCYDTEILMATSQHKIMRCSFLALALLAVPITCSHPSASDSQHHTYKTSLRWRRTGK